MLRISWIQKITHREVLNKMQKQPELLNLVKQRKIKISRPYNERRSITKFCD